MSFLAAILWCFLSGSTVLVCPNPPLDYGMVGQVSTQQPVQVSEENQPQEELPFLEWAATWYNLVTKPIIQHTGYAPDDERQKMVQYAYKLWWVDFVLMLECESWSNPYAVWDSWRSYGLCQINTRWHSLPDEYKTSWQTQVEYCYQKWKWWTRFYWPQRKVRWVKCSTYVKNRFIINK